MTGATREAEAKPPSLCRGCGYDLRALPAGNCPECGTDFDPGEPSTFQTPRRPPSPWLNRIQLVCALHPVLVLAVFYFMMGLAWIELGRLPQPYVDDPTFFRLEFVFEYALLSCVAAPVTVLVAFALGMIILIDDQTEGHYRGVWRLGVLLLSWVLTIAVVMIDPGDCWNWFLD